MRKIILNFCRLNIPFETIAVWGWILYGCALK